MRYLVWSVEHRGWWKQSQYGYTTVTHRAGRFTQHEAEGIIGIANRSGKVEEFMVPAPDQAQMDADLAGE